MKTKLTKSERTALAMCEQFKAHDGGELAIEWRKSRDYGYNPVILWQGDKACNVSGCGYCKHSTALAYALCWLFPVGTEEHRSIARTGGAGVSSVTRALLDLGWKLEATCAGSSFDGYRISRVQ